MTDLAIKVKDITKVYKLYNKPSDRLKESLSLTHKKLSTDHYALNGISFDVKKGETVGLIGTNGAGKSTILKIITGVLNPTEGELEIDGRISALLELGAGFNMEYTGIENVYLNGTMIGFTREEIDERLDDIIKFADIGDFINQPVKTYSSGMFVRLAFAVAINIDPEILIVDEALSVGDVFFQSKCYNKFEEFKKQGKTILFVSHDLSSISKYCDRVVLLNKGTKLAEGQPREMIDLYKKVLVGQADMDENAFDEVADIDQDSTDVLNDDKSNSSIENNKVLDDNSQSLTGANGEIDANQEENTWKSKLTLNPDVQDYGSRLGEIVDFAIFDDRGNITNTINKGTDFTIQTKMRFHAEVQNPIFTFTIKSLKGDDITGTNTMLERVDTGIAQDGDVYVMRYTQKMNLQGGEYLLSLGCTGYRDGDFTVYNRLYDVCNIAVVSDKNTVGLYDMDSTVVMHKNDDYCK